MTPSEGTDSQSGSRRPSLHFPRRWLTLQVVLLPLALLAAIVVVLVIASEFQNFGLAFFGPDWNPNPTNAAVARYGVLDFAVGSAITSAAALVFALLLSVGVAVALVVYLPRTYARPLRLCVDLLAGIPSVVYGIWGYVVLAPYFGQSLEPGLVQYFGWLPGFRAPPSEYAGGTGLLLAIVILTLMVVPLTASLIRESLASFPRELEESGFALGATRWEVVRRVRLPYSRAAIFSAALLGFGRAIGETVAVFMVIANEVRIPGSIYSGASTISTILVGQFDSAFLYPSLLHALVEIALLLFAITLAVNIAGRRLLQRFEVAARSGNGSSAG